MAITAALASTLIAQSCTREQNVVRNAEQCVRLQVHGTGRLSEVVRKQVAQRCNRAIQAWAFTSTRHAYGDAFDPRKPIVAEEYRERKAAIIQILMPLEDD
ncbi:hypothetical protein [Sphingomonas aerophila]|uniref:Uncharacterized protein n=1 Tax=Sphingomonas aerophila TaxID=1344948 RepID=A0A7W9EX64_9SPHN|nr:hypothetical protein [Sphingomonas aerophila]MBB5716452.1 hypothetical protein [Sphingomonas aerophila]